MITLSDVEKCDSSGIYKVYDEWPQIAKKAYELDFEKVSYDEIDHIVFAGMGGSGAIGDLFSAILSKTNFHVNVVKGYTLPKTVDSNTLVITTSVSGNTEETLAILKGVKNYDCKTLAFSSGGKMEQFCSKNNIAYRKIPQIHSPRASFTTYVYSIIKLLNTIIPVEKNDILESIKQLDKTKKQISTQNLSNSNPALKIAYWMTGIPLIYYPAGLAPSAIRFKNSLQENVKIHAMTEDIIEACHNSIVSWEYPSNIKPILIEGIDDYPKTKERWSIVKEFFKIKNIDFQEIFSVNGSILSKLINLIYLLDYVSIYRAVISNIDPTPIPPIDFIKEKL